MALGADAVYIGTIALMAMLQTQMNKALPTEPPTQAPLYQGKFKDSLITARRPFLKEMRH